MYVGWTWSVDIVYWVDMDSRGGNWLDMVSRDGMLGGLGQWKLTTGWTCPVEMVYWVDMTSRGVCILVGYSQYRWNAQWAWSVEIVYNLFSGT